MRGARGMRIGISMIATLLRLALRPQTSSAKGKQASRFLPPKTECTLRHCNANAKQMQRVKDQRSQTAAKQPNSQKAKRQISLLCFPFVLFCAAFASDFRHAQSATRGPQAGATWQPSRPFNRRPLSWPAESGKLASGQLFSG